MLKLISRSALIVTGSVGILFGGLAVPYSAAGEPPSVINALIGSWRGSGTAKAFSDADPETVNCKARYTLMADKDTMKVEVTCASANGKGLLVGFIKYTENSSSVTGSWYQKWSTSEGEENGSLTGTISDASIVLDVSAAGSVRGRLTLTPNSESDHSVEVVGIIDGEPQQGMKVNFRN